MYWGPRICTIKSKDDRAVTNSLKMFYACVCVCLNKLLHMNIEGFYLFVQS